MYGSYESTQYTEIGAGGEYHEVEFQFGLNCTSQGCKAQLYGPPENCYTAEAAEFELDSVHVLDAESKPLKISEDILVAIIGQAEAAKLLEQAITDALENSEGY